MQLNDLLKEEKISPKDVLVMRHRPTEIELRKRLPWLAAENPSIFNAYQQTQTERAENALLRANHLVSFIGNEAGKATFVGLYKVGKSKKLTYEEYHQVPAYKEMKAWGHAGFSGGRPHVLWFDLKLMSFRSAWSGKLIVKWPPPERSWFRWADKNQFFIEAILDESQFTQTLPEWNELSLTWEDLRILPTRLRDGLQHWRGVYLIFDIGGRKFYVGSAYGKENILGRWITYSKSGHGGNKLLRECDPKNLRFSILQRVSPDLEAADVIKLENSWKLRLLTREFGLNVN